MCLSESIRIQFTTKAVHRGIKVSEQSWRLISFLFACRCLSDGASRGNSLQQISKSKISQQLHEMNEQFDAIEQLTSNMEEDLQRSNRVRIHSSRKGSSIIPPEPRFLILTGYVMMSSRYIWSIRLQL